MSIAVIQILAPDINPDTLEGKYIESSFASKARLNYHPFHVNCWDVPTWCVGLLQRMNTPYLAFLEADTSNEKIGYEQVFGSVMSSNLAAWKNLIINNPNTIFNLGGYVLSSELSYSNVLWMDTIDKGYLQLRQIQGVPAGVLSPRYFPTLQEKLNGVRLQLSVGCLHNCDFCVVPGKGSITSRPENQILSDVYPLINKPVGVVYLDDKTFGQANNWQTLSTIRDMINPDGFVVQTTALQITQMGLETLQVWKDAGIIAVEIGVESFNDDVLKRYRKPARKIIISEAVSLLNEAGLPVCPNIIIGMNGETYDSYQSTASFIKNIQGVGWFNLYCLADYNTLSDADESTPIKSWQTTDEQRIARFGYDLIYNTVIERDVI